MSTSSDTGGRSRPTIVDVAQRAGVSKSLVSLVLRGQPGASESNRTAVLRAAEELGYRANAAARSLAQQRTHTVGAVLSDLRNPWFIDLLAAVRAELTAHGLTLFLSEDFGMDRDASVLDAFIEARVDGLLCLGTLPPAQHLLSTARTLPTVVAAGREPDLPNVDVVTGDDRSGAARAVDHLVELGHRRIAHLAGTGRAADLRTDGYRDAMRRHGLDEYIRVEVSDRSEPGDHLAAVALLQPDDRPTAILANNDYAAVITMSHAKQLGLDVPHDLSVVGYDNSYLARLGYIGLTTLDNNYADMGRLAVQRLLARIADPQSARTVSLLDPELKVGSTSGNAEH
ncbi:LacI family DNA-binding transcriptional regulator [Gordonia sp. LSe1-13]|uniref:LacI family DNA-binding transcriptional regulator n=1 Tax=Gordonia sesuvii TaxID=3116777 RepID=A0ABU7MIS8_9ACTN|nr:LacI family DNA-binding transcriptional regulator [Gordonia sp. LSe1-13]